MRTKKKTRVRPIHDKIDKILLGIVPMESESPAIQSACQLYIYQGAVEILNIETKEARNRALDRIPKLIRPYVKAEAMRIWELRKENNEVSHHVERAD